MIKSLFLGLVFLLGLSSASASVGGREGCYNTCMLTTGLSMQDCDTICYGFVNCTTSRCFYEACIVTMSPDYYPPTFIPNNTTVNQPHRFDWSMTVPRECCLLGVALTGSGNCPEKAPNNT